MSLNALSPLDGRYEKKVLALQPFFSEAALMRYRLLVEIRWLEYLAQADSIAEIPPLNPKTQKYLNQLIENFSLDDAQTIKKIEQTTNHDLKAVEYFLKEKLAKQKDLKSLTSFIHFSCTSEDINNTAYALMLKDAREQVLSKELKQLIANLHDMAQRYADLPMLAKTHGQAATPTTLGKELAVFVARLNQQVAQFDKVHITAKFNGATGNYNAHHVAYPAIDWPAFNKTFIENLALEFNTHTTQIEPHDMIAELMHTQIRINNILIDCCRDIWQYISQAYFKQQHQSQEVGSSTMPHKINPIDFENAEGNLGLSNALAEHFANKLPISRLQRDLSDSTVLRNLGVAFGHSLLAYHAMQTGLGKLEACPETLQAELEENWAVITEAVQTVMRRHGIQDAYEQLKAFSRGKALDKNALHVFIEQLPLPDSEKAMLKKLSPHNYTGLAAQLTKPRSTS